MTAPVIVSIDGITAGAAVQFKINGNYVWSGSTSSGPQTPLPYPSALFRFYRTIKAMQDHAKAINFLASVRVDGTQVHAGWNPPTNFKTLVAPAPAGSILWVDGALATAEPVGPNSPPPVAPPAGVVTTVWGEVELASGQWKDADAVLGAGGGSLRFRTPVTSTHDRTLPGGGGQIACDFGRYTAPTNVIGTVYADGLKIWDAPAGNQLQVGFGMDTSAPTPPNTPFVLPLDSEIEIGFLTPTATYASTGAPQWIVEVSLPGREGATYTWS